MAFRGTIDHRTASDWPINPVTYNRASRQHFVSMVTDVIHHEEATALKGGGCF